MYPSRHWIPVWLPPLLLASSTPWPHDAASTTGEVHLPKLVATTAVRGQGGKPKAGAWTPSSIDCLRNMYTSEMCVRAAARVLCLRVSSLYL